MPTTTMFQMIFDWIDEYSPVYKCRKVQLACASTVGPRLGSISASFCQLCSGRRSAFCGPMLTPHLYRDATRRQSSFSSGLMSVLSDDRLLGNSPSVVKCQRGTSYRSMLRNSTTASSPHHTHHNRHAKSILLTIRPWRCPF